MTYDPKLFEINKITIDGGTVTRTPLRVSSASLTEDMQVGVAWELSFNPATGVARFKEDLDEGFVNLYGEATPVEYGYEVEWLYDSIVVFQGFVSEVSVEVEANEDSDVSGKPYTRTYQYSFLSKTGVLADYVYTYGSLPEENPVVRLERADIDVDTSLLSAGQLTKMLSMTMNEIPENADASYQSMTYLQMARMFTEVTHLPLRPVAGFDVWRTLEVVADTTVWNDVPLTPALSANAVEWARSVRWVGNSFYSGARIPVEAEVAVNNTSFLGGFTSLVIEPDVLGTGFILGSSRLGISNEVPVGFRVPAPVDVMGHRLVVSRLTQSFGQDYVAQIELTGPTEIDY